MQLQNVNNGQRTAEKPGDFSHRFNSFAQNKTKNSFSISWIVTKLTYLSQEKQNYASEKI